MIEDMPLAELLRPDGARVAYRHRPAAADDHGPGVMFIGGFRSDMKGGKAVHLDRWCAERGIGFIRFDPFGHGESSGAFTDGTIGRWGEDTLAVLDEVADRPQILVGSSMGGWLMTIAALARPEKVAGLVGVAAAPDFTEDLMWPSFSKAQRRRLEVEGVIHLPSIYGDPTPVTRRLIEEAEEHLVLRQPIPFTGPVRLLHGLRDPDVPYRMSMVLAEKLTTENVRITLVKDGDHRLSRPQDLDLLAATVAEVRAWCLS